MSSVEIKYTDQVTGGNSHNHTSGAGAQISHANLSGLSADGHVQYHTDSRAATWHSGLSGSHIVYPTPTGKFLRDDATWQDPGASAGIPSGVICMWSGTIATIPVGWYLCDGNNSTPDLRDKFIVGAKQDDSGVAKSNIEGTLKATGGVTGHLHSAHANLTHTGGAVADHTNLTHGLSIGNHPDLTHAALADHGAATYTHAGQGTHAAVTLTHGAPLDHAAATYTHAAPSNHAAATYTHAQGGTHAAATYTHAAMGTHGSFSKGFATGTGQTAVTVGTHPAIADHSVPAGTHASVADHSIPAGTHAAPADHSIPAGTHAAAGDHALAAGTHAGIGDHAIPAGTHAAIASHVATDYGVHAITAPAAHGTAGTVTHSFTEPSDHSVSAHDTVLSLPVYFALAFIMKG